MHPGTFSVSRRDTVFLSLTLNKCYSPRPSCHTRDHLFPDNFRRRNPFGQHHNEDVGPSEIGWGAQVRTTYIVGVWKSNISRFSLNFSRAHRKCRQLLCCKGNPISAHNWIFGLSSSLTIRLADRHCRGMVGSR